MSEKFEITYRINHCYYRRENGRVSVGQEKSNGEEAISYDERDDFRAGMMENATYGSSKVLLLINETNGEV